MEKTRMPTVAGILDIVAGSLGLIIGFFVILLLAIFTIVRPGGAGYLQEFPVVISAFALITLAIFSFIISVLAIVGGVYALRKKKWGLALAGSIAAFFVSSPLGIAAIVLIALSKNEF